MSNRLENLRTIVEKLIMEYQPRNSSYFITHLYGVSEYAALLAYRRDLNPELASTCGMLHDIYQVTAGTTNDHGKKGAKVAKKILKSMGLYSNEEIEIIRTAIKRHSKKKKIHEPYDELLKDADVLSHQLYNTGFPIINKEKVRYENLLVELGCKPVGAVVESSK